MAAPWREKFNQDHFFGVDNFVFKVGIRQLHNVFLIALKKLNLIPSPDKLIKLTYRRRRLMSTVATVATTARTTASLSTQSCADHLLQFGHGRVHYSLR